MSSDGQIQGLTGFKAAVDLSAKQYFAVRIDETSGQIKLGNATSGAIGILRNKPVTGRACEIARIGDKTEALCSGTVSYQDRLASDANGYLVATTTDNDEYIAIALGSRSGANDSRLSVLVVGPATHGA